MSVAPEKLERQGIHKGLEMSTHVSTGHPNVYWLPELDAYYNYKGEKLAPKDVRTILSYMPKAIAWADRQEPKEKAPIVKPKRAAPKAKKKG